MQLNEPVYHKQKCDTAKSYQAFLDFRSLPRHVRSVPTLLSVYQERVGSESALGRGHRPPSLSPTTLEKWCYQGKFHERAKAYDETQKDALEAARQAALESGLIAQAKVEQDQIEGFRMMSLNVGKNMIAFAQDMLDIVATVPVGLDPKALTNNDLARLMKATSIYKSIAPTISIGGKIWGDALGVSEAISLVQPCG
jgi:hypothetical protein